MRVRKEVSMKKVSREELCHDGLWGRAQGQGKEWVGQSWYRIPALDDEPIEVRRLGLPDPPRPKNFGYALLHLEWADVRGGAKVSLHFYLLGIPGRFEARRESALRIYIRGIMFGWTRA
jgi:hypothetical protein